MKTRGGAIAAPPIVPGFTTTGAMRVSATGPEWAAVRSLDGRCFALKVIAVEDLTAALALAAQQMAVYDEVENEHLIRRHGAIALTDGTLALVLDEAGGGSLAQLVSARGQLTAGETITIIAPLFRALADLHAAGVVHGDLAPGNLLFNIEGRPLIGDLGVVDLLGRLPVPVAPGGTGGFVAPELAGGDTPTPASDVYAMAALGWFCLTGAPPAPAASRRSLSTLRPDTSARLVEALTAALATDPSARPGAGVAAVEAFDAAPAESVALVPAVDPAAEITRRIRAAAAPEPESAAPGRTRYRTPVGIGVTAVLVVGVTVAAMTGWFPGGPMLATPPARVPSAMQSREPRVAVPATTPVPEPALPIATLPAIMRRTTPVTTPATASPATTPPGPTDVLTAPSSPRIASAPLLQALADARALAYLTRSSSLLDLVYAPGAPGADVDRSNIATALENGGTYLGLSFVIKNATFLDGTAATGRIRATILTPAYQTGQPDGRTIPHPQESLGPCLFSLSLTPEGWRILALTTP